VLQYEVRNVGLKTIKLVVTILVSAKANKTGLNNLILLIAISYTISSFQVQKLKIKEFKNIYQELMKRLEKKEDTVVFFVGLSMIYWAINDDCIWELVENLMSQNRHKLLYYKRGLKATNTVFN
jgi:hypothetical protein